MWVEGEISNFTLYGSGHAYFTLKDETAQLRAVLFRNRRAGASASSPEDGLHVLAFGGLEVYAAAGRVPAGRRAAGAQGARRAPARLRAAQAPAGGGGALRSAPASAPLPALPAQDRHRDLADRRRHPRHAARHRPALRRAPHRDRARAGAGRRGAARDRARRSRPRRAAATSTSSSSAAAAARSRTSGPSTTRCVARAIAASKVPVISAVGHEVDFTIADFVADLRAPTPSARPSWSCARSSRWSRACADLTGACAGAWRGSWSAARARRAACAPAARAHRARPRRCASRRAGWTRRARACTRRRARAIAAACPPASSSPTRLEFASTRWLGFLDGAAVLAQLAAGSPRPPPIAPTHSRHRLGAAAGRLDSLSPLAVLGRGYSLTRRADGRVVRSAAEVRAGRRGEVLLHEGSLDARVTRRREHDDRPQV